MLSINSQKRKKITQEPDLSMGNQIYKALNALQAVIEFKLDGTIVHANDNFLQAMGYKLSEIVGRNHKMFMPPEDAVLDSYRKHWEQLRQGHKLSCHCRRIAAGGREIWLQAHYVPILNADGELSKVVKFATDVTEQSCQTAEFEDQIKAICRTQAVIEFNLDGTIRTANENFQNATGYRLEEIRGKHHRMFVDPKDHQSREYLGLWEKLNRGEYISDQFRRVTKSGETLWLQAIYNPIFDPNGRPTKVIKYASDITAQVTLAESLERLVKEANDVMNAVAQGDLSNSMKGQYSGELAELSSAINATVEKLKSMIFEVIDHSTELMEKSNELSELNDSSFQAAVQTAEQTKKSSSSASQISSNMSSVAQALQEMTGAIHDIAKDSTEAVIVAEKAVELSESAKLNVGQLTNSSTAISTVIKVINSIADQTNLLALNATIEAARAGDAGRGFAVVANEVKELAKETARATEDVSQKISKIQSDSQMAEQIINEINTTIGQINVSQSSIADTVDAQRTSSSNISESINRSAQSSNEIAASSTQTADLAEENLQRVEESQRTTRALKQRSDKLGVLATTFTLS